MAKSCMNEEPDDDSVRTRKNVTVAIVLALLVLVGVWLVSAFRSYVKTEECFEAGRRNCMPIDLRGGQSR
jgi:hypothetical protein